MSGRKSLVEVLEEASEMLDRFDCLRDRKPYNYRPQIKAELRGFAYYLSGGAEPRMDEAPFAEIDLDEGEPCVSYEIGPDELTKVYPVGTKFWAELPK